MRPSVSFCCDNLVKYNRACAWTFSLRAAVPCPPPPPVPNAQDVGSYRQAKVYRFGDVFAPKCRRGFAPRGPRLLHCDDRGQWNSGGEDVSQMACVGEYPHRTPLTVASEKKRASAIPEATFGRHSLASVAQDDASHIPALMGAYTATYPALSRTAKRIPLKNRARAVLCTKIEH